MFFNIFFIFLLLMASYFAYKIVRTDFKRHIIPDIFLFPLMLIGLTFVTFYQWPISVYDAIIGGIFGYIISTIIGIIFDWRTKQHTKNTPAPIGMGDIKLITTGGFWLGTSGLAFSLIVACISGAIWGACHKQRFIPFAPFFILGAILALITTIFLL